MCLIADGNNGHILQINMEESDEISSHFNMKKNLHQYEITSRDHTHAPPQKKQNKNKNKIKRKEQW